MAIWIETESELRIISLGKTLSCAFHYAIVSHQSCYKGDFYARRD